MFKKIMILFLLLFLPVLFCGCFDVLNLNENAYLLAVGIDKGVAGKYRFSLQFAQPVKSMGSDGEHNQTGASNGSEIVTIDASDIVTAIYSVKDFKSKRINGSHMKILVFGEEVAREGIGELLASFIEPGQLRTNIYLSVARGMASDYLNNVEPQTEIFLTKFYERQFDPMHGINMAAPRLYDTFFTMLQDKRDVILPLVGVNYGEAMDEPLYQPRGYVSGEIPRSSQNKTEMAGNAYFNGEKMIGIMTQMEADAYFVLKGVYAFGYLTVPDPVDSDRVLVLNMEQAKKPKISVNPQSHIVSITLALDGVVYYGEGDFNYADHVELLESYVERIYTTRCLTFITARQKEGVDVLGVEKYIDKKFFSEKEREAYAFDLKKMKFEIETKVEIKRTGKLSGLQK